MTNHVTDFLDSRIQDIYDNLKENNVEYACSIQKTKELIDIFDKMIFNKEDEMILSISDRQDVEVFLENDFTRNAIIQEELYKQGYLDCIKLLRLLEVIR
ncbi:hypothetical protein SDC9_105946 [bioreactor metagenome]|uniref:Uncharacterized protein n=1 Tax=bioreactor metagenome TaxID=1076179 RepID=A0A645B207_9ZZZZ